MAFEFLNDSDLWNSINAGSTVLGRAGGIYQMFQSQNPYRDIPGLQDMINSRASAQEYQTAAANPLHPFNQNLQKIYTQQAMEQASNAVKQILLQARRGRASGVGSSLIQPERRDEMQSGALARAFMGARFNAMGQARQALENAAGGFSKLNYLNSQPAAYQQQYAAKNRANTLSGYIGLSDLFSGLPIPTATSHPQSAPTGAGMSTYNWPDAGQRLGQMFMPRDFAGNSLSGFNLAGFPPLQF